MLDLRREIENTITAKLKSLLVGQIYNKLEIVDVRCMLGDEELIYNGCGSRWTTIDIEVELISKKGKCKRWVTYYL